MMNNDKEILSISGSTSVELKKKMNESHIKPEQIIDIVYGDNRFVCFYYR